MGMIDFFSTVDYKIKVNRIKKRTGGMFLPKCFLKIDVDIVAYSISSITAPYDSVEDYKLCLEYFSSSVPMGCYEYDSIDRVGLLSIVQIDKLFLL